MSKTIELVIQRASRAGLLTQETHDAACLELQSLVADATLYRAMRAIATEPDMATRERMSEACDVVHPGQFFTDWANPTNEQYDAFAVHLIGVANANR